MTPEMLFFRAPPGKKAKVDLTLYNDDRVPVQAHISLRGDEGKTPWLRVPAQAISLSPGERRRVTLRARAPRGEGERTVEVVVSMPGPMDSEVRIVRRATLIMTGTERYAVEVGSVAVRVQNDGAEVTADCRNTGNMRVRWMAGVDLTMAEGEPATVFQEGVTGPLDPGETGQAHVTVPLRGRAWTGHGTVRIFFREGPGGTLQVIKTFGPMERSVQ
ncbi:MAG: hypothetical protein IPP35_08930 [Elusimicrobia bacterium]|nr:hypothetical protein [Elusimicrobiota bacterium]